MFSILHISDLHRAPKDNITNPELISALISDRNRYVSETPAIRAPDAIVVSGDIILGVPLGTADAEGQIATQYSVAFQFLTELANRFLDGDRSRIVIVPGNHDIDWVTSRTAMTPVPVGEIPGDLPAELQSVDSLFRWSWKTREVFLVSDPVTYEKRTAAFWAFFNSFYNGSTPPQPVASGTGAHLYSLCNGRIGVAAFNSCHGNDCFAFHGSIPREVIAQAHLDLMDKGGFELLIAVWHHNIEGPPYRSDYMDVDIVRGMVGRGFRLGLYGHHHRGEAGPVQIHLASGEAMAVVSAASLCAGARELPTGTYRGYNIIEVHDDMCNARVHMREMSVANLFSPSRRASLGGASWVELSWQPPADLMPNLVAARRTNHFLELAEVQLRTGSAEDAKQILLPQRDGLSHFGRMLLLETARQTNDTSLLIQTLTPPQSIAELIELTEMRIRENQLPKAREILEHYASALSLDESHLKELRAHIATAEAIKR